MRMTTYFPNLDEKQDGMSHANDDLLPDHIGKEASEAHFYAIFEEKQDEASEVRLSLFPNPRRNRMRRTK